MEFGETESGRSDGRVLAKAFQLERRTANVIKTCLDSFTGDFSFFRRGPRRDD